MGKARADLEGSIQGSQLSVLSTRSRLQRCAFRAYRDVGSEALRKGVGAPTPNGHPDEVNTIHTAPSLYTRDPDRPTGTSHVIRVLVKRL
jgi:hypothetical protein